MLRLVKTWRIAALLAAIVLLNASITFYNVWPTPKVRWHGHLSAELAAAVLMLAAWVWRRGRAGAPALRVLAAGWTLLVVGRYLDVVAPALYGRPVNLFWDIRHLGAVAAMMTDAMTTGLAGGALLALALVVILVYLAARWAFARVAEAMEWRQVRHALGALALGLIVLYAARGETRGFVPGITFSPTVSATYWHQAEVLAAQLSTRRAPGALAAVSTASDLARVRGADVYLVFVESYGAVAYDRPDVATPLAAARARFASDVAATGRRVVSAFVDSPTFGGSSWLAHVSLMTGVEARDEDTNVALMAQTRQTLVTTFARQGYRTVALMPGLRHQWPEGAFYGFDHIYDTDQLNYRGPRFGWWTVPDQFALAKLDALEDARPAPRAPRFVFFPTTSTHAPFGPTAPYQPDWRRLLSDEPYVEPALGAALAGTPDYLDLAPSYVNAVSYAYATIAGYLQQHAGRDLVMVVVGDHQPASAVSGEGASWDVPVHVIASRPAVLERLVAEGFQTGVSPARQALGPMHALLPTLLTAFGDASARRAAH